MNEIFQDLLYKYVVVYLDDILIFSRNLQSHHHHVKEVLTRLHLNRLYCKLEKCLFEQHSVPFLGYVISGTKLEMDPSKVQAVLDWTRPATLKAIQRFIGFSNYYRKFIKGFSALIAPITALTHKGADPSSWSEAAESAFHLLKQAFITAPVLRQPDVSIAFILEVDASSEAVGAVLSQKFDDNCLHPCGFFS